MLTRVVVVVAFVLARPALAGPYCGGGAAWSPMAKQTLPVRPRLVYAVEDRYYASTKRMMTVPKFAATIDGKPAKISVDHQRAREYVLFIVDVLDDREGALEVSGDEQKQSYTIDHAWKAGTPSVTTGRYHEATRTMALRYKEGLVIGVDVPAIAFSARWRRDSQDTWRALKLPAIEHDNKSSALLGGRECTDANVPEEWLERGVELEIDAWLPDRSRVRLKDLPNPVVMPAARRQTATDSSD